MTKKRKPDIIEVYRDKGGKWRWRMLCAYNRRGIGCSGESFSSKSNATASAYRIIDNHAPKTWVLEIEQRKWGDRG